jgi:polysaccharide export outer membrane protein
MLDFYKVGVSMNASKAWRQIAIATIASTLLAACASGASSSDSSSYANGNSANNANGPTGPSNGQNGNNSSTSGGDEATDPAYQLVRGDEVYVNVYNEADLSIDQRIDSRGVIRLPYMGEVAVSGQTVREAEKNLEKLFVEKKLLRKPMVNITVRDYASHEVSVIGAVNGAGRFRMPKEKANMEILDLITSMGGFRVTAKSDEVKVTRTLDSGEEKTYTVDVEAMIKGKSSALRSFLIYPGDRIFVPERLW